MTSDLSDPAAPDAAFADLPLDAADRIAGIRVPRLGEDATGWSLDASDESVDDRTVIAMALKMLGSNAPSSSPTTTQGLERVKSTSTSAKNLLRSVV